MVSAEFEPGCTSTMMQSAAAAATDPLSPEASYLRGMAAAGYPHPESGLPHPHHPHMQVRNQLLVSPSNYAWRRNLAVTRLFNVQSLVF